MDGKFFLSLFFNHVINGNDSLKSKTLFIPSFARRHSPISCDTRAHPLANSNRKKRILIFIKLLYKRIVCVRLCTAHFARRDRTREAEKEREREFEQATMIWASMLRYTNGHAKKPKKERIAANLMVTCINLFRVHINLHHWPSTLNVTLINCRGNNDDDDWIVAWAKNVF